jgi:leucyl aminopeptidase
LTPLALEIRFAKLSDPLAPVTAILIGKGPKWTGTAQELDQKSGGALSRSAAAADFTAKARATVEVLAPAKLDAQRVILAGVGSEPEELDRLRLGGTIVGEIQKRKTDRASIIADVSDMGGVSAAVFAAQLAEGALLRRYEFRKYMTQKPADDANGQPEGLSVLTIHTAKPEQAAELFAARRAVVEGVCLARDLVNEPSNVLGPVEFATRAAELRASGLEIDILDIAQMQALNMGSLLSVGQGSARPSRLVVMQWHGVKSKRVRPVCFVGKGVTFDTGGISIKPAAGMEDMKGDMGGAACVTGLMHALAARKASVNAVGLIGLVENMPSGSATRPGDIVTSMSGQTIEIINTDAEGRLVLADVLWYAQERFKPRFIIDLATLTGAIVVALGKEHAGLFANDDKLAAELIAAGKLTGEAVWRMPLTKAYDKLIDTRNADMKNTGGRHGGAITAAQFLQRFVKDTPWAHLDVAGVAMDSVRSELNQSWASGWGVRLLDRLVTEHYEKPEK